MIEFIAGSVFGFGTFMLSLIVAAYLMKSNAESYKKLLSKLEQREEKK